LKHYRLKLDYLKKLTYYNKRKAILTALSENVQHNHHLRQTLLLKLPLFTFLKLREPFTHWHQLLLFEKLNETALWFRSVIWPKHVKGYVLQGWNKMVKRRKYERVIAQKIKHSGEMSIKESVIRRMLRAAQSTRELERRCQVF
jgi:hypothetical protein